MRILSFDGDLNSLVGALYDISGVLEVCPKENENQSQGNSRNKERARIITIYTPLTVFEEDSRML